jgi:hypothetical protein
MFCPGLHNTIVLGTCIDAAGEFGTGTLIDNGLFDSKFVLCDVDTDDGLDDAYDTAAEEHFDGPSAAVEDNVESLADDVDTT